MNNHGISQEKLRKLDYTTCAMFENPLNNCGAKVHEVRSTFIEKPGIGGHLYGRQKHIEDWIRSQRVYPKFKSNSTKTLRPKESTENTLQPPPARVPPSEGVRRALTRFGVPMCFFDYCRQRSPRRDAEDEVEEECVKSKSVQTELKVLRRMRGRG